MSATEEADELADDVMDRCWEELAERGLEDATVTRFTEQDLPVVQVAIERGEKKYGFDLAIKVVDVDMDVYDHQIERFLDHLEASLQV